MSNDLAHAPTAADVEYIAHLTDPVIRNLQITQCYHEASDLFEPPFAPDQITALKAGRLPVGGL